ncbi:MAG: SsrA-binding protein SmpB [Planctomycetes bacterium]|nr:SsrA-binding protein SmpB [Planctomycetota bacterium]
MNPRSDGRRTGAPGGDAAAKKPPSKTILATNRKARHDYAFSYVVEAGLVLLGSEVKSLRTAAASLQDGYARVDDDEVWLYGVHVPPLPQASYRNHEPRRKRKCLLHLREIRKLAGLLEGEGTTMIPLSLYFLGSRVKVELGVGRGKRQFDKREDMKQREADRATRRAVRRG